MVQVADPAAMPARWLLLALLLLAAAPAAALRGQSAGEVTVGSIDFKGNRSFDGDRLRKFLSVSEDSEYPFGQFDSAAFLPDLEKIEAFYASEGFRRCRGLGVALRFNGDSTEVDLEVRIDEGPPTVVDTIAFTGDPVLTRRKMLKTLGIGPGDRYERQAAAAGKTALGAALKTMGYLDARVEVGVDWRDSSDFCGLSLHLDAGPRFIIDSVRMEGLETVRPQLAEREFEFAPGEHVDLDAIARSQRHLYETNLFRSVSIKTVPTPDTAAGRKDILVRFTEEDPGRLELSLGVGTIDRVRGGAFVSYENTFGEGYRSGLGAKASAIELSVTASLDNPRMFDSRWGTSIVGTVSREEEPSYVVEKVTGQLNTYRKFLRRSRLTIIPSYETGRFLELKYGLLEGAATSGPVTAGEIDALNEILKGFRVLYDRWGLKTSVQLDLRNSLLDPTAGTYADFSGEFIYGTLDFRFQEETILPSINRLLRIEGIVRQYAALDRSTTIATSVESGIIVNLAEREVNFLLDDLFHAGGPTALRGFEYKKIGPLSSNGSPLGGRLKFTWNVFELRRRIVGIFGAVAFFDLGSVWPRPEDFRWSGVRYSPGAGLRIDSPIGVVRFDVGLNPWPRGDEAGAQWWFGIGHAF